MASDPVSLQGVSIDPLGPQGSSMGSALPPHRVALVQQIYVGFQAVQGGLVSLQQALSLPTLPGSIVGSLVLPDGSAGANLQLQFDPASIGATGPVTTTLSRDAGEFVLAMPSGATIPASGITLTVHGANTNSLVSIPPSKIAANGLVGTIVLPTALHGLPVSILQALMALTPPAATPTDIPQVQPPLPQVTVGEPNGPCTQTYTTVQTNDSFPFGVFFRLVDPQLSMVQRIDPVQLGQLPPPAPSGTARVVAPTPNPTFADRVPIEQPLDVDVFLQQLAGIDSTGSFVSGETVPMAATLGLGYVLWLSQNWSFQGVGLGDLVYSLPLAPGEQVQIAVFERTETDSVFESESFSEEESSRQQSLSDTSTNATFASALSEKVKSETDVKSGGQSQSIGGSIGGGWFGKRLGIGAVISGGAGSSQSSSSVTTTLTSSNSLTQSASDDLLASAESSAAARRSANRTGMRLASSTESQSVTTKTITNHNHGSALTMQYWEVLRSYDVGTAIDGLTLACLVPMKAIRFMPAGQASSLTNISQLQTRADVLTRYAGLIAHLDVLLASAPRRFQYGLRLLEQFASDPNASIDSSAGVAEDVVQFSLQGNFLACEIVSVVAVTRRGTRVGPLQLVPTTNVPTAIPDNVFASGEDLIRWLLIQRQYNTAHAVMTGSLALPPTLNRTDIVGFEITRRWNTVACTLAAPASGPAVTVTLTPAQLETQLGGVPLDFFAAAIQELSAAGANLPPAPNETFANDPLTGTILPLTPFPIPALQLAPILRYQEILEIEKTVQHVVRNTLAYSQAVWGSLSDGERAILLDAYTIGVPSGGVSDPSQLVPLLSCVQNRLVGFYGNSMILPFSIPQAVAESMNLDQGVLEAALLAYQQASFKSPHSTITLPTRGVLGEAVLGHCPSAEKIDLTRFWNWQDSPADTAPSIAPITLPTSQSVAAGLTAPNSLSNVSPLINNILQAPTPGSSLADSLVSHAAPPQGYGSILQSSLDPATQANSDALKTASQARADALTSSQQLLSQVITTAADVIGGGKSKDTSDSSSTLQDVLTKALGDLLQKALKSKAAQTAADAAVITEV